MSSILNEWIKEELYPSLYDRIDEALPEFQFKRKGKDWVSTNKRKITGEEGDSIGKVYVYANNVGYIKDYTRDSLSIVSYVMEDRPMGFLETVKSLADIVGLQLPKGDFNEGTYKSYKEKADILEDCSSYFSYCLETAKDVKEYLASRGYSDEDIKAMELGYIPAQDKLFTYLLSKGHSQSLIEEVVTIKHDTRIGSTHKLTIPYRSGNSIKGFKFRNINHKKGDKTDKYLNSKGLDKNGGFFNLLGIKGDKDVVIVEGELDSLSAIVKGVENVVACGGSSISPEQIKDAIRKGAKSFTICFDTVVGKEKETSRDIEKAIAIILAESVNRVYIVNLPDINGGKTDPDSLIKEKGVEAFKQAITEAVAYWEYKLRNTLIKYSTIQEERELQARDIDSFLDEVVETSYQIVDPIDKDRYKTYFISLESIKGLGISSESWDITIDRLTATRDKENQTKELRRLLSDATNLQSKGETDKALELLDTKLKEVKLKDKTTEFSSLLLPTSEAQVKEAEENKPKDLETGYTISGEDFSLPAGAITVYAGATNHGKTILSINTALNVAERYPDKKFIFFTYEERDTAILQYFLNTYINKGLNSSEFPKSNRRVIKEYFKTGSTQYISRENLDDFQSKKEEFFTTYIETGRILVKYVDFSSQELDLAIRYLHKNEPNIGGVFVDYFQLLNLPANLKKAERINSRQEELKEICQSLKRVAIDTGLPLILGAQFNRDVTDLAKLHPTKVSEAGDIERIVNTLVGLWDISKNTVSKDTSKGEEAEIKKRIGEHTTGMYVELLKSRELQTGIYELLDYNSKTGKIKNKDYSKSKNEEQIPYFNGTK